MGLGGNFLWRSQNSVPERNLYISGKTKRRSHKYPHASQSQRSDRISAQWTLATKQEGKHENGQVTSDEGSEKATLLASLSGLCSSSPSIHPSVGEGLYVVVTR